MNQSELFALTKISTLTVFEQRIANCEKARDMAHDPDIKILWQAYALQLRNRRMKGAH
jgi:pterin-4a-carbinolamine dehydratase